MSGKLRIGVMACVLGLSLLSIAYAQEAPTANLNVSVYSQYIWRGYELSKNSAVFFPSLTVGWKGFACNVWVDFDTNYHAEEPNTHRLWETDWVLTYANSISKLKYTVGWIYYDTNPPQGSGAIDSSAQELFLILGLDWPLLNPTFSVWSEIQNGPSWYMNLALSHSFGFGDGYSFDVGGWVSYWDKNNEAEEPYLDGYRSWHDGNLWAGLKIPLNKYISLTPKVQYSFPLSTGADRFMQMFSMHGNESQFVYGGLILDVTF